MIWLKKGFTLTPVNHIDSVAVDLDRLIIVVDNHPMVIYKAIDVIKVFNDLVEFLDTHAYGVFRIPAE